MKSDSFTFRGVNFLERFGIKVVKIDYLLPPKRKRKTAIPQRHGMYDHGAVNWEERIIRIDCDLLRRLTRAEVREISALLSRKGSLYLWDEPDKYYVGEIYDAPEIFEYPKASIRTFKLEFECEPFAYAETTSQEITSGVNIVEYAGTVESPARIILSNPTNETISNIRLNVTMKKGG